MLARIRRVDVILALVVVVVLAAVGSTMLAGLGPAEQQARCAANMRLFGEALAGYEVQWDAFPLCDPWPVAPQCSDPPSGGDCRVATSGEQVWDPPHGRLLHQMGYIPNIPTDLGYEVNDWYQWAWGFYRACTLYGRDGVPPVALCPSAILDNVMSETSTEIDFGGPSNGQYWVQTRYKYAACYTPNRLLRSPTYRSGADRRLPRLPGEPYDITNDNQWTTASVRLTLPAGEGIYYIQGVNSDEMTNPADTLYLCDSRDYRIGNGDELVDPRYGHADTSAGAWFGVNWSYPATALGSRHSEQANVLYVDGHVSDDNQTPRNRRGELVTASTFADFIEDYGIGTQHHLMPGWRWVDQTLSPPGSYAPGDDEPPTVIRTWPADGSVVARGQSVEVTIRFSEQVYVNSTNVKVNDGAMVSFGTGYSSRQAVFTLFFERPLVAGRSYVVSVDSAVTDRVGNQLDGDGDGVAGDAFSFGFTIYDEVITVDPNGGDYGTIQVAIDAAVDGDVIEVQPGVYVERVDFAGKAVTVRSVEPADPNVVATTVIDAGPLPPGPVVTFDDGEGRGSVLDGLTVTHSGDYGDGVSIDGSSPTIRRCRITANQGSGIWCFAGRPTIERNSILGNTAVDGAGVYCFNSAAVIRSNVIASNHAYQEGAAIYTGGYSEDWIINNTIVSNTADGDGLGGAAVVCVLAADAGLFSNLFWQNSAEDLAVFDSDPAVACNLFSVVPIDFEGSGNIVADPLLSDYHIGYDSPCVNAGSPWYGPMDGVTDLDGEPRIGLGRVDIGADEFQAPFLAGSEPVADGTLCRIQNNVIELSFDGSAHLIGPVALKIVPIGGNPDTDDVGGSFTYELTTSTDPNDTLRATENGAAVVDRTWYRFGPGEDLLVERFTLDLCTLHGDANGTGRVTTSDYSEVKGHMGEDVDARCDLDGSGHVTTADYSVVKACLGLRVPPKP